MNIAGDSNADRNVKDNVSAEMQDRVRRNIS